MAVKTLISVITPPSLISELQPLLASTLLETVHSRVAFASAKPSLHAGTMEAPDSATNQQSNISEQAVLVMTLIDALPCLPVLELEEWLPIIAQSICATGDNRMQQLCRERLWEVLTNGEMDVDRSSVCVAWWTTKGGRELVLGYHVGENQGPFMSGGLGEASKL